MSTAALLLALLAPLAATADLGVPKDGFDRVLLDDGRVVDARALPREGDLVPLEFAAGTIRVSRARVLEVRFWRDFDPAPRDDAEKEKTDRGFVRWKGVLVPPERAASLLAEEEEREAKTRAAAVDRTPWRRIRPIDCGPFRVTTDAAPAASKPWCALLQDFAKQVLALLPKKDLHRPIEVSLFRDEESRTENAWTIPSAKERSATDREEFPGPVEAVLGGVPREEVLAGLLGAAAPRVVGTVLDFRFDHAGGWARHGLARYCAAAEEAKGGLSFGAVDDVALLLFRDQEARGTLGDFTAVLRSGVRFADEVEARRAAGGRDEFFPRTDPFDADFDGAAWVLVHYLMEGDGGRHRKDFLGWLRYTGDLANKNAYDITGSFETARGFLLRQLKMKDPATLVEGARGHAASLEYRLSATWLHVAGEALAKRKDAAEARACAERAVARSTGDARALAAAGRLLAGLPDGAARAREVLEAAVAADPLDGDARMALAALLPPGEAEPMRALGEALGGAIGLASPPPK